MNIAELTAAAKGTLLTENIDASRELTVGCACDLLSWVMARGKEGAVWITVQTHKNVVAVASLLDMAAVVVPDSIDVEEATIASAADEGIALISSPMSAFSICAELGAMGVKGV